MYCKNCGSIVGDQAVVCVKCGVGTGTGQNFCAFCGQGLQPGAMVCIHCGAAARPYAAYPVRHKSRVAAGVLGILLGALGIHNFYLGFTGKALAQLLITVLTFGVGSFISGIWGLVEGILILTQQINFDAQGQPLGD